MVTVKDGQRVVIKVGYDPHIMREVEFLKQLKLVNANVPIVIEDHKATLS